MTATSRSPAAREPKPGRATPRAWVYVLRCRDGSFYAGAAKDVARRLDEHAKGTASRYTRDRLPVELVFSRRVATWGDALREEARIKRLTRLEKAELVARAARRVAARSASRSPRGTRRRP